MGRYYNLFIECRTPDGWAVPSGFEPEPWGFTSHSHLGEFAFAHPSWGWVDLFWRPEALFPMRQGLPEDRGTQPSCDTSTLCSTTRINGESLFWIPYEEVLIDCWDTEKVLVRAEVPARYAVLFGDGRGPFPRAELLAAGMKEEEFPGRDARG